MAEWFKGILGLGKRPEAAPKASRQAGTTPEDVWADHDRAVAQEEDEMWEAHEERERAAEADGWSDDDERDPQIRIPGTLEEGKRAIDYAFQHPHVIGVLDKAYAIAKTYGLEEQTREQAKAAVERVMNGRDGYHAIRDAIDIAQTFGIPRSEFASPEFEQRALSLFASALGSMQVIGAPRGIARFVDFMGPEFAQNPEVRAKVIEAIDKQAVPHNGFSRDATAPKELIQMFALSAEELSPIMTTDVAYALANETRTSQDIVEAYAAAERAGYNSYEDKVLYIPLPPLTEQEQKAGAPAAQAKIMQILENGSGGAYHEMHQIASIAERFNLQAEDLDSPNLQSKAKQTLEEMLINPHIIDTAPAVGGFLAFMSESFLRDAEVRGLVLEALRSGVERSRVVGGAAETYKVMMDAFKFSPEELSFITPEAQKELDAVPSLDAMKQRHEEAIKSRYWKPGDSRFRSRRRDEGD